jgi:UDP-N-acetylmuramate--alanine ligase
MLIDKMNHSNKALLHSDAILERIKRKDFDVVMTLGAGNIDLLVPQIKALLEK